MIKITNCCDYVQMPTKLPLVIIT